MTDQTYDLITSEPPPPMSAGVYRLYSQEFYQSVSDHLSDDGLMTQWLPFSQLPWAAEILMVRTFIDVFPHAELFRGSGRNMILVGSKSPIDLERIAKRFSESSKVVEDLFRLGIANSTQLVGKIEHDDAELRRRFAGDRVISDQHNDLEHLFMPKHEQLENFHRNEF